MDTRSARRGRSSPVVGDSVESGSPIAVEGIKPESSATASPLTSSTAANLNGTAAAGASEPMETTETDEVENVTKKRKTGTGSRGVANLTPEQLAKKRANGKCFAASLLLTPRALCLLRNISFHITTTCHFWNYYTCISAHLVR